jgi:hypothetical protein
MGLPENRDKTGRFVKGKSGNPGGANKLLLSGTKYRFEAVV